MSCKLKTQRTLADGTRKTYVYNYDVIAGKPANEYFRDRYTKRPRPKPYETASEEMKKEIHQLHNKGVGCRRISRLLAKDKRFKHHPMTEHAVRKVLGTR